jgi:hypothetical protein
VVCWQQQSEGIECSKFEDGSEVIADFNQDTVTVNGDSVPGLETA